MAYCATVVIQPLKANKADGGTMAKPLLFKIGDAEFSLEPVKLNTKVLYGTKEKVVMDLQDNPCSAVQLLPELSMIIPKSGTTR